MISNEIQKLLSNITKSLTKVDVKDLDAFISGEFTHVTNIDFHRYEISHREVINVKFSLSSFRGAFIMYSSFTNCSFVNCSFVTTLVSNTKFTNCIFTNCVFRAMHIEDNVIRNCTFKNCFIGDNIFSSDESVSC
jgi:hypothetical protein